MLFCLKIIFNFLCHFFRLCLLSILISHVISFNLFPNFLLLIIRIICSIINGINGCKSYYSVLEKYWQQRKVALYRWSIISSAYSR